MAKLALIPARGGSKRIPRKNVRPFIGKPIIAYSIEVAIRSGLFDKIMVSTDDIEIAEIARSYGADVPFLRSAANSDDFASTIDVVNEVIDNYATQLDLTFESVCCIYPSAPLINENDLQKGLELLESEKLSTVFPVVAFSHPVWRALEIVKNRTQMVWPENQNKRTQDLQVTYHDAGQWYWIRCNKRLDSLFTENSSSIILLEESVQDIDNESDWSLAEMKYRMRYG